MEFGTRQGEKSGRLMLAIRGTVLGACFAAAIVGFAVAAIAEDSSRAPAFDTFEPVKSMGQPPLWKLHAGAWFAFNGTQTGMEPGGGAALGVFRNLVAPTVDILGWSAEAYFGGTSEHTGGGGRLYLSSPALFLHAGADWDARRKDAAFILSLTLPLRRGGVFGRGSLFRVDWMPSRDQTFNVGFTLPIAQPWAGKTRPKSISFSLPQSPKIERETPVSDPRISGSIAAAEESARWIQTFCIPYIGDDITDPGKDLENTRREIGDFKIALAQTDSLHPEGRSLAIEQRIFFEQMAQAFGLAAGAAEKEVESAGYRLALKAGRILADRVVFPYNSYCGRYKERDSLLGFGAGARDEFSAWLRTESAASADKTAGIVLVFDAWLRILERHRERMLEGAENDSRWSWVPPQLVLRPEDHDTQAEIDAIIEKTVGRSFTRGNALVLLSAPEFHRELIAMIRRTEDYHVLWIHDYRGLDSGGAPDTIGFDVTVNGYFRALTDRVRTFDSTGILPQYFIMLDQTYYIANKGRIWLDLLENPLGFNLRLPPGGETMEAEARRAQEELRAAVESSMRLTALAGERGRGWLHRYIKVHVNVTQPTDLSFRSKNLVGGPFAVLPLLPDGVMIDHRKVAFCDATELDPSRGTAIYTGTGVGEHYASATWEDRALGMSGPAIVHLKTMARAQFLANGFKETEIPTALRPLPYPADYEDMVRAREEQGATAESMDLHNGVGFAPKEATVVQQLLYALMPPGSVMYIPDSIWTNELWAAMLTAAALRGCRVYVVAPLLANAPSAGAPQMARSQVTFSRFVEISRLLGPEIRAAGGALHAGMYTRKAPIGDIGAQFAEIAANYAKYSWLRDEFPFPDSVYAGIESTPRKLEESGITPVELTPDVVARLPKLHRKTQFFITRELLRELAGREAIRKATSNIILFKIGRLEGTDADADFGRTLFRLTLPAVEAYRDVPGDLAERSILYMTVGSLNKDPRGMFLDGEVLSITRGPWSILSYPDMFLLMGSVTWLESQEQFEQLWPTYSKWQRRIAHYIRKLL